MELNQFNEQLGIAKSRESELQSSIKSIRENIDWYESTNLTDLFNSRDKLKSDLDIQSQKFNRFQIEKNQMESSINVLSKSVNSLWNPKNWLDSQQREIRRQVSVNKMSLLVLNEFVSTTQVYRQDLECKIRKLTEDIEKYKNFDYESKCKDLIIIEEQLSHQKKITEQISERKHQVDALLAPIVSQIHDAEHKRSTAISEKIQAQRIDKKLSNADSAYDRAMLHQECEKKFGTGSPSKVISQKESEIRRLDRDLEKLYRRAKNLADKAARNIKKLILDGNNLCYQGDSFIGLSALKSLVPILANNFEVVLVFDASIRKAIGFGDTDIRDIFGGGIQVHVVATGSFADETVLDLAESDKSAFIVSNDRFAEFGDKSAIREQRVIRHEIVSGQVLIHDLDISVAFIQ